MTSIRPDATAAMDAASEGEGLEAHVRSSKTAHIGNGDRACEVYSGPGAVLQSGDASQSFLRNIGNSSMSTYPAP